MKDFVYNALPARVIFGSGTLTRVPDELDRLGCSKALILSTQGQARKARDLQDLLGTKAVGIYPKAVMHTPTNVTEDACKVVEQLGADCVVSLGGGSAVGLAKAIAFRTDLPQIVIPTTYSGSEATPILGQTENGLKTTQRSMKVLPEVIIYDVSLTLTLSPRITVTSGINAIAHAVEALYSKEANPVTDTLALQGLASIAKALPILISDPASLDARSDALYGAWACASCLGVVGMALHHKLCHTLGNIRGQSLFRLHLLFCTGGTFGLPHAATHTVILPHAIAYNTPYAEDAMSKVAKTLGSRMQRKELGMKEEDREMAADIAAKSPYPNPAPLVKEKLLILLKNAFEGLPPGSA
ncbi:iron-containing alcohol dehydrogenase [Hymenopellis radicata]|nr:iron-containing alcohol dehydrogenase [Hymenopellis radicata]